LRLVKVCFAWIEPTLYRGRAAHSSSNAVPVEASALAKKTPSKPAKVMVLGFTCGVGVRCHMGLATS
jgi:hypothetical protein